jgi:hypothetical protein
MPLWQWIGDESAPRSASDRPRIVGGGGYRDVMTAAEQPERVVRKVPFVDASPAEVRAALIPEEAEEFDRQWAVVMARATRELDLTEVLETLESWRRIAWITAVNGPERHRQMLRTADERQRTGARDPNAISWEQLRADLGLIE